jgi:TRAP-type C4-dicarboxylate transport system permease small subunit
MTIFLLNVVQVGLRYFIGETWLWVPDFLRLLFIWCVFLGATVLYASGEHLMVDYFVRKMRPRIRDFVIIGVEAAAIAFFAILVFKGLEIAERRMRIPFDTWDFPTGYAYVSISVCAVMMALIAAHRVADRLRNLLRKGGPPDVQGN